MKSEDVRTMVGSVVAVAVLFGFVMWPLMDEQQRSRVRTWLKPSLPVNEPSAKEAFEMKIRCSELKTKWEKRFETDPGITFDQPGFTALGNVCYSPKHNTCLGKTVSTFNCGSDKRCSTEYATWDLVSGNKLTGYCWFKPPPSLKLGSCEEVYFDADPKKTQETKAREYVAQAQADMKTLEESCLKEDWPWEGR